MVLIPVGYAQVNYRFEGPALANPGEITFGVGHAGFSGTPLELAEALGVVFGDTLAGVVTTSLAMIGTSVKYGPSATGPSATDPTVYNGEASGAAGASAPAFLIHKNTDFGGRAGRGRMYLPGVPEAAIAPGGALEPAFADALNVAASAFFDALEALLVLPVLLHGPASPLEAPTPITSFSGDPMVGTQRRRQRR